MEKKTYIAPTMVAEIIYKNGLCEWLDNSNPLDAGDSAAKRHTNGFEDEDLDGDVFKVFTDDE